jgi:hypothetical protein
VDLLVLALVGLAGWGMTRGLFAMSTSAALLLALGYWLYGRLLLLWAWVRLRRTQAVLVHSDSTTSRGYIEERWLPRFGARVAVLNWSERRAWRRGVEVRLWQHFCGTYRDYCPAVIVLRGVRSPQVFRFYEWFRRAKQGDANGLIELERHLFVALGVDRAP